MGRIVNFCEQKTCHWVAWLVRSTIMDGIVARVKVSRVEHGSLKSRWRDMLPQGAGAQSAAVLRTLRIPHLTGSLGILEVL